MPLHSTFGNRNDIYINPDRKELKALFNKYDEAKALLHGNDMYAWHADYGYHDDIRKHLGYGKGDAIGLYLCNFPGNKYIIQDGAADLEEFELAKLVNEHPIVKRLGYKLKEPVSV